ncbi:hypothetical protein ACFL27_15890 [candidate division CSSED10-310 bacterium]|uniref:Uncharacterized protein n=1 Tax=candidate division CSSED10-310 bacterium TaxID=2855610 RepID=A0ABV6YZQ4_UNCC1
MVKFKQLIMSAQGRDHNQFLRALDNKIREMIDIITDRDEYRNSVKPMDGTQKYWSKFVKKCQRNFEQNLNPNPGPAIERIVGRVKHKRTGQDLKRTQSEIMKLYKEGDYFRKYVANLANSIASAAPVRPKYESIVHSIFNRFLQRKPSTQGGADSEMVRFVKTLETAGTNNAVLENKIMEVVDIITDRDEFRKKAGYQDWTIKYWTEFIKQCARTFEGRETGADTEWANKIVVERSRYKTINYAQNVITSQFKRSDRYNSWVKMLAAGKFLDK